MALIVFNSVPLEETVRLVEFMTEIKGSYKLTKHLNTYTKSKYVAQFSKAAADN